MTVADEILESSDPERRGPSRRTMLKAAAWSVPVIVVAQAAPALAQAGPSVPVTIDFDGSSACKIPGSSFGELCYNKGYVLWANFKNTLTVPVTITVTSIAVSGTDQSLVGTNVPSVSCGTTVPTIPVPANSSLIVGVFSNGSDDSRSTSVTVGFTYTPQNGSPVPVVVTGSVSGYVTGSPWQGSCAFPDGTCSKSVNPPSACGGGTYGIADGQDRSLNLTSSLPDLPGG